jgi:hypothetical protein
MACTCSNGHLCTPCALDLAKRLPSPYERAPKPKAEKRGR